MFISVGRDGGKDPDWDPVERKWKGKRNSLNRESDSETSQ